MCYHVSTASDRKLKAYLGEYDIQNAAFYYHTTGFSHLEIPVTLNTSPRVIQNAYWGLIPGHIIDMERAEQLAAMTLNARSESIFTTASYKNYIGSNRCLIWVDGFYEWQHRKKDKIPYYIYMKDNAPFSMAGVYSIWERPADGKQVATFSLITTEANTLMSEIHNSKNRMPLILQEHERDTWLGTMNKEEIAGIMKPLPDGILQAHTISKLITARNADSNVVEVQEAYSYEDGKLF